MSAPREHLYLSTYCLHGQHPSCRLRCKLCQSPCVCACHDGDDRLTEEEHGRALAGRALLMPPWGRRARA